MSSQKEALDGRREALNNVITSFSNAYNFSSAEIVVHLSKILKQKVKEHVDFGLTNMQYAPQILEINKDIKSNLNDCVKLIEKRRNTLRSVVKEMKR